MGGGEIEPVPEWPEVTQSKIARIRANDDQPLLSRVDTAARSRWACEGNGRAAGPAPWRRRILLRPSGAGFHVERVRIRIGAMVLPKHPVVEILEQRREAGSVPGRRDDNARVALAVEGGGMRGIVSAAMLIALADL